MSSLKIKDHKVLRSLMLVPYHHKMIALAMWIFVRLSDVVITRAYGADKIHCDDSGIASTMPCRHMDIRSWIYDDPEKIVDDINNHWIYDPDRLNLKCALLHDTGKGMHIHLQVHDNTQYHPEGGKNDGNTIKNA